MSIPQELLTQIGVAFTVIEQSGHQGGGYRLPVHGSAFAEQSDQALVARSACWCESIAHPTTRRKNTSITTQQYTPRLRISVHSRFTIAARAGTVR